MNEAELSAIANWHYRMNGINQCQGCFEEWPCQTERLRAAYSRLRNAALAIIENPQHVDVPDVVLMLGRALAEEE